MKLLGRLAKSPPLSSTEDKTKRLSFLPRLLASTIETIDQTWLLVWKTTLVLSRHPLAIWAQVLTPILVCCFVFGVQCMVDTLISKFVNFIESGNSRKRPFRLRKGCKCAKYPHLQPPYFELGEFPP